MQVATITDVDADIAERLIPDRQVADRYRISPMTLWRWDQRGAELGFPAAVYINKRKYRRLSDLLAWERSRPQGLQRKLEGATP
jgi:hypothetical protein